MNDFRLELKEEYKTFVLQEQCLCLERVRYPYEGGSPYIVEEYYDYQDFKEVILTKESIAKEEFVYGLTLKVVERKEKRKEKFIFKNILLQNDPDKQKVWVVAQASFESFAKELFERLKPYPQVEKYAYQTAQVKLIGKLNRKVPAFYVGGIVLGGAFFLKVLSFLFKATLKLSLFYWLDAMIMNIGGVFALLGMAGAYFINQKSKKESQIQAGESFSPSFFAAEEATQKQLIG